MVCPVKWATCTIDIGYEPEVVFHLCSRDIGFMAHVCVDKSNALADLHKMFLF